MPITNDILDHEVIGPAILQGRREGREEGRKEGREEGRKEGRQEVLREAYQKMIRRVLERRFGALPGWAASRLADSSVSQLEEITDRLLDAASLKDLFSNPQ